MLRRRNFVTGLAGGAIAFGCVRRAGAAPKAELWPRWQAHDAASRTTIDHGAWDAFLKAYVVVARDGINRVAFGRVGAADRAALANYLDALASVDIDTVNRAEQLAYWINLYNALTVRVVLDHYPVKSIRDIGISPGLFSVGPWGKALVRVKGEDLSLDDIEHRILRPRWRDNRVHYAVNCASLGCPNLMREAHSVAAIERLLTDGAHAYVNHPRGARVVDGRLSVSSLYVWFKEDFGGDDAGVIAHLKQYADPALAARLAAVSQIADDAYDWALNDAR